MAYKITAEPDYLRAELQDRETVEETQAFLRAVVRENAKHRRPCVLIAVRLSKPVFQVAAHGLIEYIAELSAKAARRIALVGDTRDLHMSHQYIELLARQRGLNVQSFGEATAALEWLGVRRQPEHGRQRQERTEQSDRRRDLRDRRSLSERRRKERRTGTAVFQSA
jgi:hypothetical protein